MKMMTSILLVLCTQLLVISLHHHLIHSKGLSIQQLQGAEGVEADGGNVQVKLAVKAGKGPYGGANMNRDPRASKSNASSSYLPRAYCISISVGFFILLLFGF